MTFKPKIVPLGDAALLVQLGDEINVEINHRVQTLAALIDSAPLDGVIETVPAYSTLLIHYDPLVLTDSQIRTWVRTKLVHMDETESRKPRQIEVPLRYGGEYGPDLESVAAYHGLHPEDVIRIHSEKPYVIYMMGFTPGFPYMGKLHDAIATPRLETPRKHVPAGTVAIAGSQTGIYPVDSPGGWRLIGWTSLQLFDPKSEPPFLFSPGDEVRFVVEY
ncbi:MAG TPA: 5-oxoprolinase subunit PxpB [Anaerolineales bacterium]|nr:5-oxoprolinase subunit PxpB [Anaerolineales bacterium]